MSGGGDTYASSSESSQFSPEPVSSLQYILSTLSTRLWNLRSGQQSQYLSIQLLPSCLVVLSTCIYIALSHSHNHRTLTRDVTMSGYIPYAPTHDLGRFHSFFNLGVLETAPRSPNWSKQLGILNTNDQPHPTVTAQAFPPPSWPGYLPLPLQHPPRVFKLRFFQLFHECLLRSYKWPKAWIPPVENRNNCRNIRS